MMDETLLRYSINTLMIVIGVINVSFIALNIFFMFTVYSYIHELREKDEKKGKITIGRLQQKQPI